MPPEGGKAVFGGDPQHLHFLQVVHGVAVVLGEQTVGLHGLVFVAAPEQVLGRLVVDVAGRRRKKKKTEREEGWWHGEKKR